MSDKYRQPEKLRMAKAMRNLRDKGWFLKDIAELFDYTDKSGTRVHDLLAWLKTQK